MKKSTTIALIFALLLLLLPLSGCNLFSTDDEIEYKNVDGGVALYRYEGNSSHDALIIPDEVDGKPVVEIQKYAVGACEYLSYVHIGKNVRSISERAFCGTNRLIAITVSGENPYFTSIDGVLYNKDATELHVYPGGKEADSFTLPDGVIRIDSCAFYMCEKLKAVTLSESVKEVGEAAFLKCTSLEVLNLNEGLLIVEKDGFSFCENLKELHLPSTIEELGDYAFYSKTSKITSFTTKKNISEIKCGKSWRPQTSGLESSALTPTLEVES